MQSAFKFLSSPDDADFCDLFLCTLHTHSIRFSQSFQTSKTFIVVFRSWKYPNSNITAGPLHDVRCTALSLLSSLLSQLSNLLWEPVSLSGVTPSASMSSSHMTSRQFSMFVRSLLNKYDLGRTAMACLESSVMALQVMFYRLHSGGVFAVSRALYGAIHKKRPHKIAKS